MGITVNICITILVIILAIIFVELSNKINSKHSHASLNIEQLIQKYGYPLETHQVVTDDGYFLTLHRMPHGRRTQPERTRIPVLFMHGLAQSDTEFINVGPEKALPFLLADNDYDIWLGNARGTTWSRKHKQFNANTDKEFWNFSGHEIGIYDTPAFIDYILETTKHNKLQYVGYSQGTSVFFILVAEKPQYADKVILMSALAPAIFIDNVKSPYLNFMMYFRRSIENILDILGVYELLNSDGLISIYLRHICNENSIFVELCVHHMFSIQGYSEHLNKTMLSMIYSNTPAGISLKALMHFLQVMESGNFSQYDLGTEGNLHKYGQKEPPKYDLSKVTTPVALYYSSNDDIVNIDNMKRVIKALPNVVKSFHVPSKAFNHNDFIHADNVVSLLYNSVIEEISKY